MTTERISREVLSRLNALGSEAEAFAEALAVVGSGPELRIAAAVADLDSDAASRAAEGSRPPGSSLAAPPSSSTRSCEAPCSTGCRWRACWPPCPRGGAARRGRCRGRRRRPTPARVQPDARPEVVAQLRQGARDAVARGVPASAVSFSRRATREPTSCRAACAAVRARPGRDARPGPESARRSDRSAAPQR